MVPFAESIPVRIKTKPNKKNKIDPETGKPWEETVTESVINGSVQTANDKETARMQLRQEGMTSNSYMKVYSEDVLKLGDEVIYNRGPFKMVLTVVDADIFQYGNSTMNHYCYYCTGSLTNV